MVKQRPSRFENSQGVENYCVAYKKEKVYVSRAVFEILALKGPKLAQMAKHMIIGLEDQTRTFFHLISSTEY